MKKLFCILLLLPLIVFAQTNTQYIEQDRPLNLFEGWNMIGFTCNEPINVIDAFLPIYDKVIIAKDNNGAVYLPEFAFNGIGFFEYGYGYQLKLTESISDFQFCPFLVPLVEGCIDQTAFNYNSSANIDDGSCVIYGCTNPYSQGGLYNPLANVDDGSCILIGCADSMYVEYYTQGFISSIIEEVYNDLFCSEVAVFGCTDNGWLPNGLGEINDSDLDANPAINYNPDANVDDESCISESMGCTDSSAFNYNSGANLDDGSCYPIIYGCIDPTAFNFNDYDFDGLSNIIAGINGVDVNTPNGSCYPIIYGCLDPTAFNFNDYDFDGLSNVVTGINGVDVNTSNGVCIQVVNGCTDANANNFSPFANTNDGSCIYFGCVDLEACNYNPDANMADESCSYANEGYDCEGNVCPEDLTFLNWLQHNYPSYLINSNCIDIESASSYMGPIIIGPDSTMQNIDGIQYFNNTTYLEINGLSQLIEIPDISGLTNLETLAIGNNDVLTSLPDLSDLIDLSTIGIGYNYSLESLPNLSELSNLTFLDINDNYSLTTLPDLSRLTSLDTLLIYNNNSLGCALAYPEHLIIQEEWPPVCEQEVTYQVGDLAEGGIVFYIDETGQHGLVAALEDLTEGATIDSEGNPGYQWGCFAMWLSGADGLAIGTGYQNTLDIASGCSETPIAASEALAFESEGYSDWYLPSLDELKEMFNTIGTGASDGNIGSFEYNWYWSSSESNNYGAYDVNFGDGSTGNFSSKTKIVRVRVIRSF